MHCPPEAVVGHDNLPFSMQRCKGFFFNRIRGNTNVRNCAFNMYNCNICKYTTMQLNVKLLLVKCNHFLDYVNSC